MITPGEGGWTERLSRGSTVISLGEDGVMELHGVVRLTMASLELANGEKFQRGVSIGRSRVSRGRKKNFNNEGRRVKCYCGPRPEIYIYPTTSSNMDVFCEYQDGKWADRTSRIKRLGEKDWSELTDREQAMVLGLGGLTSKNP